jgi:hypothetical protein
VNRSSMIDAICCPMRTGKSAGLDGQTVRALCFRKNGNRVGGRCMLWIRSIGVIGELLQ